MMEQPIKCGGVADQASRLREMSRTRRRRALTLAVTSGKGGVGKTNVAVNLSLCLAARGINTVLADVDLGLANADLLLNLQPRYTLSHAIGGLRDIREISIEGPAGLKFVPGASGVDELANLADFELRHLMAQLQQCDGNTDIIVLDCGAGIARNVMSFALAADRVLVVTTPQPTALTDAYAMIKALHREGCVGDVGLLVNMAQSSAQAARVYERLSGVARRFLDYSVANGGYILQDTAVEVAVQERTPLMLRDPDSNAGACIAAIAEELARTTLRIPPGGGLLKRVVRLFV